ncbi:hypothetical protein DLJ59_19175 [Micromonospora inaquosa]|uniref:Uncharacterized protein n=1 Tax=Micromonospora inaquosa TaxID=2203716 RepID=A0A3N9WJY7_9ACTN|nr:hypothetical protein DLJ59_19175 [Micromonospora inaquosa]
MLDARGLQWVSPLELAAIVTMGTVADARGREVRLLVPHDPKIASYLVRMNVVELLKPFAEIDGAVPIQERRDHSDKLLEVAEVTPTNIEVVCDRLGLLVTERLGPEAGRAAFDSLAELLNNATTHGYSKTGAFTAAQLYSGTLSRTPGFEFAVCDCGDGIQKVLSSATNQDLEGPAALELALNGGVRRAEGRGHGLPNLWRQAIRGCKGGELMLRSGGAVATAKLRSDPISIYSRVAEPVDGTWAWLRVRVP